MAEQIGYNFIINMLLSPSAKMQYVGKFRAMQTAGVDAEAHTHLLPFSARRRSRHRAQ